MPTKKLTTPVLLTYDPQLAVEYRPMTLAEAKVLVSGSHVEFRDARKGQIRRLKVNGAPRTWKRDPDRVEVPGKYGLYEYATFTSRPDGSLRTDGGAILVVPV